jgi:hypothetical protein
MERKEMIKILNENGIKATTKDSTVKIEAKYKKLCLKKTLIDEKYQSEIIEIERAISEKSPEIDRSFRKEKNRLRTNEAKLEKAGFKEAHILQGNIKRNQRRNQRRKDSMNHRVLLQKEATIRQHMPKLRKKLNDMKKQGRKDRIEADNQKRLSEINP